MDEYKCDKYTSDFRFLMGGFHTMLRKMGYRDRTEGYDEGTYWDYNEVWKPRKKIDGWDLELSYWSRGYTYSTELPSAGRSKDKYMLTLRKGDDYLEITPDGVVYYTTLDAFKVLLKYSESFGITWPRNLITNIIENGGC